MRMHSLPEVERERSELLQILLLVVMVCIGVNTYISFTDRSVPRFLEPTLAILSLAGCLYVVGRERHLGSVRGRLINELVEKRQAVNRLGDDLMCEKIERESERARAGELEQRLHELGALYRAIRTINAIGDHGRIHAGVLHAALELVGADVGSLMLLDDEHEYLRVVSEQGLDSGVVMWTKQKVGEGVAGWVAAHDEPVMLEGPASRDERFTDVSDRVTLSRSMCVPLSRRGVVVGVLNLGMTTAVSEWGFSECNLRLASIFAEHATMAIEHAEIVLVRESESLTATPS